MLKRGYLIFAVLFFATVINECIACFRSNEHQSMLLKTGSSYYQECQCTEPGFTVENLQWLDEHDQPIEEGPGTNKVYTEVAQDTINLHIPSISKSMSGKYKCVTEVDGIRYTQSYTIDAYEPLYFFKTPIDQHLVFEHNSTIVCEARGESLPRIRWQKEIGEEFVEVPHIAGKYEITLEGLMIKNVSMEDAGKYKCIALVMSTGEEVDKFIDVDVQTAPIIKELRAHPDATVATGQSISVECLAEGVPTPQYVWKKNRTKADEASKIGRQLVNTLVIDVIQTKDEGLYECIAYNEAGSSKKAINITVLGPPVITHFTNITEVEGTTIQLVCNATGKPEPNITITYEGWDVESDWELSEYEVIPNKAFVNLDRSHEGIYICNASNEVGYDIMPMYLTVLHRPYFKDYNYNTIEWGYYGKAVKLNCAHSSNPPAIITWRFESNDIPMDEQIEINKALLDVKEPYLNFDIDGNTTYGMYVCTARNELGEATKFVTLKEGFKPLAIENQINITDLTATTVSFHIEGPFKEDTPDILGYTAQFDEDRMYDITDIHLNRTWSVDRPYKIDKLKPNTTYQVSFAAINEVGTGEYTDLLEFTTLEKSVPESPIWEEATIQRSPNGNHLLKWKEVVDNGEPIDFFVLKYCPIYNEFNETLCEVRQMEPTTELELSDFDSNTTYFLELVAHNAEGNSTPANISITIPVLKENDEPTTYLSGGTIIGISIVAVLVCLLLLDLLLLVWRRQGIIATCCLDKKKKNKEETLNSRDKKSLLIVEPADSQLDNSHRKYEYNKNTGVVTGKHSAV